MSPPIHKRSRLFRAVCFTHFSLFSLLTMAQSFVLEEVVVTAQKRAENVREIPVAVSAFNADSLQAMGVNDFADLAKASSAISITQNGRVSGTSRGRSNCECYEIRARCLLCGGNE